MLTPVPCGAPPLRSCMVTTLTVPVPTPQVVNPPKTGNAGTLPGSEWESGWSGALVVALGVLAIGVVAGARVYFWGRGR